MASGGLRCLDSRSGINRVAEIDDLAFVAPNSLAMIGRLCRLLESLEFHRRPTAHAGRRVRDVARSTLRVAPCTSFSGMCLR